MQNRIITYGYDPGFKHGALVRTTIDVTPKAIHLLDWELLTLTERNPIDPKATPSELARWTHTYLADLLEGPGIALGIEWVASSVYWKGTNRVQVVNMSYVIGYLTRAAQTIGLPCKFVSPAGLKSGWGISPSEGKNYISRPQFHLGKLPVDEHGFSEAMRETPDVLDATLISIMAGYVWVKG